MEIDVGIQRSKFKEFLEGFVALRDGNIESPNPTAKVENYKRFLDEFKKSKEREESDAQEQQKTFNRFLNDFANLMMIWRKKQRKTADDFNIMEVLGLASNELSHSKLLAWLLNSNTRQLGTHYQGSCGFRAFLKVLNLNQHFAEIDKYDVQREVVYESARLDIEICAPGHFLIGIETKIDADERESQTLDEWNGMTASARRTGTSLDDVKGFFITRRGIRPECDEFKPVTWHVVSKAFDLFAEKCEPPEVNLFARHCAKVLRNLNPGANEILEEGD